MMHIADHADKVTKPVMVLDENDSFLLDRSVSLTGYSPAEYSDFVWKDGTSIKTIAILRTSCLHFINFLRMGYLTPLKVLSLPLLLAGGIENAPTDGLVYSHIPVSSFIITGILILLASIISATMIAFLIIFHKNR